MDASGSLVTRVVHPVVAPSVEKILVDIPGELTLSSMQKKLIALITEASSTNKLKTKEDCIELYHSLTALLGKWVVSELPAAEQKLAMAALSLGEIASAGCLPWLSKK